MWERSPLPKHTQIRAMFLQKQQIFNFAFIWNRLLKKCWAPYQHTMNDVLEKR